MLISVDPGKSGAWAVFSSRGQLIHTHKIVTPPKTRYLTNDTLHELMFCIEHYTPTQFVIEGMLERRMLHQSPKATNTTAANHGRLCAIAQLNDLLIEEVQAKDWKKRLGLSKDKDESTELCRALYDPSFLRKPRMRVDNVDIAEAILIGHDYGMRELSWNT